MTSPISAETKAKWETYREAVRQANPIDEIVGRDAKLIPEGRGRFKCCSPLRKEKTPSFYLYVDQGRWHDFGTGTSGDVFRYVEERDRVDFVTAIKTLATLRNIESPFNDSTSREDVHALIELYKGRRGVQSISTEIVEFMHGALPTKVRDYLRSHYGLTDEFIDRFKVGWAPGNAFDVFLEHGHSKEDLLRTGFFLQLGDKVVDFFDKRIVFPYWNGAFVSYAIARRFEGATGDSEHEKAKYKKLLTHNEKHPYVGDSVQNDTFYNEDVLRTGRRPESLIIVEGVTDCAILIDNGYGTFSPITTRFRARDIPKLVALLEGFKGTIYICNDADVLADGREPGKEGALATAAALFRVGLDVKIVELPRPEGVSKIDVNEFFAERIKQGLDPRPDFDAVLARAKRVPDFLIDDTSKDLHPKELEARLEQIAQAAGTLQPIERDMLSQKAARRFKVRRRIVDEIFERHIATKAEAVAEAKEEDVRAIRVGSDKLRGKVNEDLGFYFVENQYGDRDQISSFSLRLKKLLVDDEQREHAVCDVMLEGGGVLLSDFVFRPTAWHSRRDFIRSIPSTAMQWTGSDDNVQGVLRTLTETAVPKMRGTSVLGYHEIDGKPRFVTPQGTIAPDGWMSEPDISYVPDGSTLAKRLDFTREDETHSEIVEIARTALPLLFNVNEPGIVWPIAGWFFACAFKPRIMRATGSFPSLCVYGTQGSGKTSIIQHIFWRLQGAKPNSEVYSVTETDFIAAKNHSCSNAIAIPHDEYKPGDIGKFKTDRVHRMLRRGYTGDAEERGRADQGVNVYSIVAPQCVMGEAKIEQDPALAERLLFASPKKTTIETGAGSRESFAKLYGMPLHRLASHYARWSLSVDVPVVMQRARELTGQILAALNRRVPPRVFSNITVGTFGLIALDLWAASLGVELSEMPIADAVATVIDEILEGPDAAHAKDLFDELFEQLSSLALAGELVEGIHFKWLDGKLHLSLRLCLDVYAKHQKSKGQDDRTNGLRAVRRVLVEKMTRGDSYVIGLDKIVQFSTDAHARCIVIDPSKIPETLDVCSFPMRSPASWGGRREPQESAADVMRRYSSGQTSFTGQGGGNA